MRRNRFEGSTSETVVQRPVIARQAVNQGSGMMRLMKILRCEKAATAIEYALVGALISIAALAAMTNLGGKVNTMFNNVSNHM
jgi:pilus assembly protein Flp/PilA